MRLFLAPIAAALLCSAAAAQLTLLKDIRPGRMGSVTSTVVSTGKLAWFTANDGKVGNTLWRTNGSPAGTFHLRTGLKDVLWMTPVGNKLFFRGDDGKTGDELWVSDGTAKGTHLVVNLMPGGINSLRAIVAGHKGLVYFFAHSIVNKRSQLGFWRSDGTQSGTFQLKAGNLGLSNLNLWRSVAFGKHLYFWSFVRGFELWRTDGTVAGTSQVFTFSNSRSSIKPLFVWNDRIWCDVVLNGRHELWTSDGTKTGTRLFMKGLASDSLTAAGKTMFFGFSPSGVGVAKELWKTDGTVAGTQVVSRAVALRKGTAIGEGRIFFAGFANNTTRPWASDGSAAGTKQLSTVMMAQTMSFGYSMERIGSGSVVAFHGVDAKGRELWVSDGTPQRTRQVIDFNPGWRSGMGTWAFGRAGDNYVLSADDGKIGFAGGEPYAVRLTWFGAAFNEAYGTGCAGTSGIPLLRGIGGAPKLGNASFALEVSKARPRAVAVLALSGAPGSLQLGSCTLLVSLTGAILAGKVTDATGRVRIPLPVPNNPSLVGLNFYTQAIVIDPKGSLQSKLAFSNGLRTLVGR